MEGEVSRNSESVPLAFKSKRERSRGWFSDLTKWYDVLYLVCYQRFKGTLMYNLTSGHNVADFYVSRPKPNLWVYMLLVMVFFMTWAYREGTSERTGASEGLFYVSMMTIVAFVVFNLRRARHAKAIAHARYLAFLAEHSKAQLELLLTNPTLSPQSAELVHRYIRQHFPANN